MSPQLPSHPSLEQLKKQAKELRSGFAGGDSACLARVGQHLPRLSGAPDEQLRGAEVSLQDCQHVVAREYGFDSWNWLHAVVEVDYDLLARLTDRELQTLMREVDEKDLVIAMKAASEPLKDGFRGNTSERVWNFLREHMEFLGPMPAEEVREAQRRVLTVAARLGAAGQINWPGANGERPAPEGKPSLAPDEGLRDLLSRPLLGQTTEQIAATWEAVAEQARRAGILSLEPLEPGIADPLAREGLRLAIDGTEPDLIADILGTRLSRAIVPRQRQRGLMVIEGLMGLQSGDNPRIIFEKLGAFYLEQQSEAGLAARDEITVEDLQQRLREAPFARMSWEQIATLFTDMGYLARRQGIRALQPLRGHVGDAILEHGLQMVVDETYPDQVMATLETELAAQVAAIEAWGRMVIAGTRAIQEGARPDEVARRVVEAAG